MFVGTSFSYNGKSGDDMYGLKVVRTSSGLIQQTFGLSRKTLTDKIKNRSKVYTYGVEQDVLSFEVEFAKEGDWTYQQRIEVARWLLQKEKYLTFVSDDYPLEFDCMATDQAEFYTNGKKGCMKVKFECNSSCAYSPTAINTYNLTSNTPTGTIIEMYNKSNVGDMYFWPEIQFKLSGTDTGFSFTNLNDDNRVFAFTGLSTNEEIYVNNETEKIYSATSNTRLSNLTDGKFFRLVYGLNRIKVIGTGTLTTRMRYPMMI